MAILPNFSSIEEALMEAPELTREIKYEEYPFEDLTEECIEEPAPDTVRYADKFKFVDEEVTIFDFVSGIVL